MADYVHKRFGRMDTVMIPYGIDLPAVASDEEVAALTTKYGLHGKRVILSLGHLHALRNRIDLVKALPAVKAEFPDVRVVIVGSGRRSPRCRPCERTGCRGLRYLYRRHAACDNPRLSPSGGNGSHVAGSGRRWQEFARHCLHGSDVHR